MASIIGNKENLRISSKIASSSITLIKDSNSQIPIKPEKNPATVIFFILAIMLHFFAVKGIVIKSKSPNIIKKLFVPIVREINGTEINVPITLPDNA